MLGQSVFVYTHTGELKRLPKGSTVVDFAYTIHTQLGNEMGFAKVNGRVVNAQYTLNNGEVVEVRTRRGWLRRGWRAGAGALLGLGHCWGWGTARAGWGAWRAGAG